MKVVKSQSMSVDLHGRGRANISGEEDFVEPSFYLEARVLSYEGQVSYAARIIQIRAGALNEELVADRDVTFYGLVLCLLTEQAHHIREYR